MCRLGLYRLSALEIIQSPSNEMELKITIKTTLCIADAGSPNGSLSSDIFVPIGSINPKIPMPAPMRPNKSTNKPVVIRAAAFQFDFVGIL